MRGEIITIGDELLTGKVCDLNAHFLSGRVTAQGLEIRFISSVGDDEDRIIEALNTAVHRSEFVLVSGGLGPTEDDITTAVAARYFARPLILDETFFEAIRLSFKRRHLAWEESYRKMAMIPRGARLIDPEEACGFYLYSGHVPVFFLPGVPEEVRMLSESRVIPILAALGDQRVFRQGTWKFFGLVEGRIGRALEGLADPHGGVSIGFYPEFPENHVRVTARAADLEAAETSLARIGAEIESRIGEHLVARDEDTLESVVIRRLTALGLWLALAESCTGGLIARRLTSVSGSSQAFDRGMVTYSNRAKQELLGVTTDVLERFGAVSNETAEAMARGARDRSRVDLGLAVTGIAGPTGGTPDKPVGTVHIALADADRVWSEKYMFSGRRDHIQELAAETALTWLLKYLRHDSFFRRH